jgi:hypothetical protein
MRNPDELRAYHSNIAGRADAGGRAAEQPIDVANRKIS